MLQDRGRRMLFQSITLNLFSLASHRPGSWRAWRLYVISTGYWGAFCYLSTVCTRHAAGQTIALLCHTRLWVSTLCLSFR